MQKGIGYDGFFLLAGASSLAAAVFLPFIAKVRARAPDDDAAIAAFDELSWPPPAPARRDP